MVFCYTVNRSFTMCRPLTFRLEGPLSVLLNDAIALHHRLRKVCDSPPKSYWFHSVCVMVRTCGQKGKGGQRLVFWLSGRVVREVATTRTAVSDSEGPANCREN